MCGKSGHFSSKMSLLAKFLGLQVGRVHLGPKPPCRFSLSKTNSGQSAGNVRNNLRSVCERNNNLEKEERGEIDQMVLKQYFRLQEMLPISFWKHESQKQESKVV